MDLLSNDHAHDGHVLDLQLALPDTPGVLAADLSLDRTPLAKAEGNHTS